MWLVIEPYILKAFRGAFYLQEYYSFAQKSHENIILLTYISFTRTASHTELQISKVWVEASIKKQEYFLIFSQIQTKLYQCRELLLYTRVSTIMENHGKPWKMKK